MSGNGFLTSFNTAKKSIDILPKAMGWKRLLNQLIQNHQKRNRMPDE